MHSRGAAQTEEKHETWYPPLHSDRSYKYPALTARQHFENAEWKAALLDDAHEDLRWARGYEGSVPGKLLLSELAARWEAMSYRERQPYEAAAKEHAARRAVEDACRFAGGASEVSLLNALLLRSPGVRMLSLRDIPWHGREWVQTPELQPEYLLRRIGAAWVELRVIHLGRASVATTDIHALVAACPQLAELIMDEVDLTDDDEALFRGLVPHAALRYVSLPSLDSGALMNVVVRLLGRCPGLSQINAWKQSCRTEDDVWFVTCVARVAKARGLRCFTNRKCVEYGQLYDSDSADSDGNYNGDGNVIKYLDDDDDDAFDAFDAYASDSDED